MDGRRTPHGRESVLARTRQKQKAKSKWISAFAGMTRIKGGNFPLPREQRARGSVFPVPRPILRKRRPRAAPGKKAKLRRIPLHAIASGALRGIKRLVGGFEQRLEARRLLELRESRHADADGRRV